MIDQPLHFIGTSHVRALEGAALHCDPSGRLLTFTALGAPLLRLLLNQCDLQLHDRSLEQLVVRRWEVYFPSHLGGHTQAAHVVHSRSHHLVGVLAQK